MPCRIETSDNKVKVLGSFELHAFRRALAAARSLTAKQGYEEVVLDFSHCDAAYPAPMLAICAQAAAWHAGGVAVDIILPREPRLARLFQNSNWAHLIAPHNQKPSTFRGYTQLPGATFASPAEQQKLVNRMMDTLLCSLSGIERGDLAAIEWSVNEITDNVLVHARSPLGGMVQLNTFKGRQRVEFSVADAGVGIPITLREGHPGLTDLQTLERAVREGVTRDRQVGRGNGLYGTLEVVRTSKGYLHIHSGYARLGFEANQLRFTEESIPYAGTLIVACMDCSGEVGLADALKFGDLSYEPLDYIQTHFEDRLSDDLVFKMHEEAASYGSRTAGEPIRKKLHNLTQMHPQGRVVIDMSEVALVSSSFADEVFGKLFVALGPVRFMSAMELRGVSPTVRSLVDRAILQRSTA